MCLVWSSTIGGWFGHSGGVNGASTYVEFQKQDAVGLIIFSNVFLGKGSTLQPPFGKVYALIRQEANMFRSTSPSRDWGGVREEETRHS